MLPDGHLGHRLSIRCMIFSATVIASAMEASNAGEGLPTPDSPDGARHPGDGSGNRRPRLVN
jgi:hypothetical protein